MVFEVKGEKAEVEVGVYIREAFSLSQTVLKVFVNDPFIPIYRMPSGDQLKEQFSQSIKHISSPPPSQENFFK